MLETSTLALETNAFDTGDQCFSTGDKGIVNTHSCFSHIHTASYQRLPNRTYVEMIASHTQCSYSTLKMGGITLQISQKVQAVSMYNGILHWTKGSLTKLGEQTKLKSTLKMGGITLQISKRYRLYLCTIALYAGLKGLQTN